VAGGKVGDAWTAGGRWLELLIDATHVLLRRENLNSSKGVGGYLQWLKRGVICCMLSYCREENSINSEFHCNERHASF
jgi:hypothetical protein